MKERVNWGVIGSGGIARRRTIPEGIMNSDYAKLVAVFDINSKANEEVAKHFNAKPSGSIKELIGSDIDAVYIATPVNLHFEHVIECARAKKHVLCEKPLGMSVEETMKMISVCKQEGIMLGTSFMMRFHSQHQAALKFIKDGRIGIPVYGRAQLSCWYPSIEGAWRQDPSTGGGGSLMDMGSHCIDLLEMFFGNIKSVSCFINNTVHPYKSEDSAVVSMLFENGAIGTVDTFFCIPDNSSKNSLELYGSKGSIIAKGTLGQGDSGEMAAYIENDKSGYNAAQGRDEAGGEFIKPEPENTYRAEIEEFSRAILEKREPSNNVALGLRSQKILAACYESAGKGQVVEIK
ncbi:MAG TPA: Gfo/Idh/MocA family oxidoreductase [Bacteroidales bacterium]|nr:Gfo/Idh/MocA family oxidoreductase [Bacteroidales bacterium]